uniref:Uncharacterized protein n=1 Tax=Syphacia muris TaxID=451379 RepID=A0A0N5ABR6_9BILA
MKRPADYCTETPVAAAAIQCPVPTAARAVQPQQQNAGCPRSIGPNYTKTFGAPVYSAVLPFYIRSIIAFRFDRLS